MYDAAEYTGQVSPRKTPDQLEKAKRNPPAVTFNERDRARLEALYDGEISYHDRYFGLFVERLKTARPLRPDPVRHHLRSRRGVQRSRLVRPRPLGLPGAAARPARRCAGRASCPRASASRRRSARSTSRPPCLTAAGLEVPEAMEGIDRNEHMAGRVPALPGRGVQRLPRRPARDPRGALQADPERHQRDLLRPRERSRREAGDRRAQPADRAALLPHPARSVPRARRTAATGCRPIPRAPRSASGRRRSRSTTRPARG